MIARLIAAIVVCSLWPSPRAQAHEIGTTQMVATFDKQDRYEIAVSVDPDALLTGLQILQAGEPMAPPSREARDLAIAALMPTFLRALTIRADAVVVRPSVAAYVPQGSFADRVQAPGVVKVTGVIPRGTRDVSFSYRLASGTFAAIVHVGDSAAQTFWLEGGKESAPISLAAPPPPPTRASIAHRYLSLGFTHILPMGLDHVLFVVGLFLLSTRWRSTLLQVSTFTLAHSITLGLTIYGIVSLPARVVEPMIALSIAYVAIENLVTSELKSWRLALVFAFGLLHGMGFAGVLRDLGLPRTEFLTALVTFNLGVEAGQLAVVALAFGAVAYWRRSSERYRRLVVQPASVLIACVGVYWTVQRLW